MIISINSVRVLSNLPVVRCGSICACSIEKPGAMMAGRVRERSNGGGPRRPTNASAAAAATAAALEHIDNLLLIFLFLYVLLYAYLYAYLYI